jgi:hypothetical protein
VNRRQLHRSAFLLVALGLLAGCSGDRQLEWTEDVRLQSGQTITLRRTSTLEGNHIAGGGGGSFNRGMTIEIAEPRKADNPALWNTLYVPILFDRDTENGEWFVVATFFHCDSWVDLGRPKLPYTEFRFRNGQWVQQALSQQWIGRPANVLSSNRLKDKHISIERQKEILSIPTISARFKFVADKWTNNC